MRVHAGSMDENIRVKKDVAAGGDLLEIRVHVEEKELFLSIVGDPPSLMNLQEKSTTSRSVLKLADTGPCCKNLHYVMHLHVKYLHDVQFDINTHLHLHSQFMTFLLRNSSD